MIGLIDVDGKLPNLALMKISSFYKAAGEQVEFVRPGRQYEHIYAASIFSRSKDICTALQDKYGARITVGGCGWDLKKDLPAEINCCRPDYDLYTVEMVAKGIKGIMTRETRLKKAQEIIDSGTGFTSRGCIRNCKFCVVPIKEGPLRQDQELADIINPRSNVVILHDNNFTADPHCLDKLQEIRDRGLIVDINQGLDIRLMTEDKARALSEIRHLRSVHYAWDLMESESQVIQGIKTLGRYIKTYRQMCFMLVGFNTSFEEDMYRFWRLREFKIDPYVMIYNQVPDTRLQHFARWVNGRFYKACKFEDYGPWMLAQEKKKAGKKPAK